MISIDIGILPKSIKGILELFTDVVELLFIVGGFSSGNELIESLSGLLIELFKISFELCLVEILLGLPLHVIWLEVFFDELLEICTSLEEFILESLEGGTINDLVGVCRFGGDSGD